MTLLVVSEAQMRCSCGLSPAPLTAPPMGAFAQGPPVATIEAFAPMANIPPFGMCTSASNPEVDAAEGAPQPCVPVTEPWSQGAARLQVAGIQPLTMDSKCNCAWGGEISFVMAGQMTAQTG